MHTFRISTGEWKWNGKLLGTGYSGWSDGDAVVEEDEGRGDPTKVAIRSVGPIPPGLWKIGDAFTHASAGPITLRLVPQHGTETYGRDGFLVHGDSLRRPGTASHGCIVLPRTVRVAIATSGDRNLEVLP